MRLGRGSRFRSVAVVLALGSSGCGLLGGVRVEALDTSVQKPANVAAYLGVSAGDEPLTELEAKNFRVYENGQALDARQIQRVLLPREAVTHERVLLLVDVSAHPTPEQRAEYVRAVEAFVRKLQASLAVSVRAFDGSPGLKSVGDYPRGGGSLSAAALLKLSSKDESRDLYGAVLAGLAELDRSAQNSGKPIELGTLVVFTNGPDLAGRTEERKLDDALEKSQHAVVGIGVGPDTGYLGFARAGVIHAQSAETLPIAFEEAGARVAATHAKYYLLSYCSPARAGTRSVRIEVIHEDKDGDEHAGSAEFEIDAAGFGPGCTPETVPRFEPRKAPEKSEGALVNQSTASDPAAVVPPPPTGEYTK
jgi:hypothetical protein